MDSYARLAVELTALLRAMKDLHAQVVDSAAVPCEPASAIVLGRLALLGPVRLTTLAHELALDPSSVSRQVATLERAGLVAKEKDSTDLRAQRLLLTPAGHEAVLLLRAAFAERLATRTPGFAEADVAALTDLLVRLNADLATSRSQPDPRQETA